MLTKSNLKYLLATVVLSAMTFQAFSLSVLAQKQKDVTPFSDEKQVPTETRASLGKVAPDLDEKAESFAAGFQGEETERVIIRLKSDTGLNGMFGNSLSYGEQRRIFAREIRNNQERSGILLSDLINIGGEIKKSYNSLGLVSAEMPLSRVRQIAESDNVEYISPDRETSMNGHVETTTGTTLVRSLVSGTTVDGRGVGVAVMDSAYYLDNELFRKADGTMVQQVNQDMLGIYMMSRDGNGHGTHVSSLIAGSPAFVGGYYGGVAPGAKIILVRVLDAVGKGRISNVLAGIDWIIANKAAHNIRVLNMSLGTAPVDSYLNDALCLATRRAVNAGIVVVASAGNNGKNASGGKMYGGINSPGIEPSVITVGATNSFGTDARSDDKIATYSSRGPTRGYRLVHNVTQSDNLIKPDLLAPGNKLIRAQSLQNTNAIIPDLIINYPSLNARPHDLYFDWTTYQIVGTRNGTMFLSGTSMSAPVVSGAAALMLQTNPALTPNLVKAILMYSAQPMANVNTLDQGPAN
ncbi:MAG: S8 family peptidase [Acidobacteria bacterium]|nr:S8 family peptidase [Acidobacteriota bacterium]